MSERQAITEEMDVHKEWFEQARQQTLETLPEFCRHVLIDYSHDYGTCVHAVAACAVAATWAGDRKVGLTGFQAGYVMWDFVRYWLHMEAPMRLVDYGEMLYPQYEAKFSRQISADTAQWLKEEAAKKLAKAEAETKEVHPNVKAHWEKVAAGWIPYGYIVGIE